jgi:hypothetical protein
LSQAALSFLAGIHRTYLSSAEIAQAKPSVIALTNTDGALGVDKMQSCAGAVRSAVCEAFDHSARKYAPRRRMCRLRHIPCRYAPLSAPEFVE